MKNKISFIYELLNSSKLNDSQRERILFLTKKELNILGDSNDLLNMKISEIEKKLDSFLQSSHLISDDQFAIKIDKYIKTNLGKSSNIFPELKIIKHKISENITDQQIADNSKFISNVYPNISSPLIKDEKTDQQLQKAIAINSNFENLDKIKRTYISPKDLKNFLIEFNQNDILKYTCHLIDGDALLKINTLTKTSEYDFQKHLKIINKEFFKLTKKYKEKINKNIHGLMGNYLNNYSRIGWSSDKIKITWSSPELSEWAKLNPGKCPNPDPTLNSIPFNFSPFKINNHETRVQDFNALVLHFKSLYHVRRNNSLKKSIELINNYNFSNISIIDTTHIRENIEFFTDMDKVKQAYKKIIEMCNESHNSLTHLNKPNYKLSLIEHNDAIVFSIHHVNSVYGKTPTTILKRQGEKTTQIINNQINGVCDFVLKADFGNNEYAEINLWDEREKEIKKLDTFEGVQYDLIFYR
jgi:hypothetical protein